VPQTVHYLVATSGKVESTGSLTLFFDTGSQYGHGFLPGDVLLAQRLDPAGGQLKRTFLTVDTVSSTGSLTYKDLSGGDPEAGQEFVRIGSTSSLDRQGHIYLTADDSNAPYIGVRDGVSGSTQFTSGTGSIEKVRMGKLSGITSNTFGTLSGYGLWASGSVYLEGGISATFGDIGGFNITDSAITSSGNLLSLKSNGQITASNALIGGTSKIAGFTVSDTQINSGTNLVLKSSGQITGSNVLFTGGKISGSSLAIDVTTLTAKGNTVEISGSNFHLFNGNITASNVDLSGNITATTGNIGGFSISSDALSSGTNFYLSGSATGTGFFISASNFNVKANGQLTASAAQITGNVTATSGNIGGFSLSQHAIAGSGFYLSGSATGTGFFISASNFNVKANGQLTASAAQITGNVTATSGNIGGFSLSQHAIAGSGFYLSGSATGTGFFISASNFNVKANGQLTASAAQITGDITATNITATTAGNIAGWDIDSSTISKLGGSTEGITLDSTNEVIKITSNAPWDVVKIGKLTSTPTYGIEVLTNDVGNSRIFHAEGTTGSLAGFEFSSTQINDTGDNLILKSNGQITGSAVQIKGSSEIAGFEVTDTQINDTGNNLLLKSNGQITASAAQITGDITATSGELQTLDISGTLTIGTGGTIANNTVTITDSEIKLDSLGTTGASEPDLSLSGSALQIGDDTLGFKGMLYAWADTFATDAVYLDTVGSTGNITGELKLRSPQIQLSSSLETLISTPSLNVTGDITGSSAKIDQLTVSGNVGIGTTSPLTKLHVTSADANTIFLLGNTGTGGVNWSMYSGNNSSPQVQSGGDLLFRNASSNVLVLQNDGDVLMPSGNVGIGTASPGAHLHIYGAGDEMLRLADNSATGNPYLSFYQTTTRRSFIQHHDTDDTLRIASEYGGIDFRTGTGGSEVQRMIIDSSGNVGIGTTSPGNRLHVSGSNNTTPVRFEIGANANYYFQANSTSGYATTFNMDNTGLDIGHNSSGRSLNLQTNSTDRLTILGGGNVGIGTISPPEKLTVQGNISASGNIILASGQGIDFSATGQAAGMSSELLDDYEEGTWTPQWVSGDFDTVTMDVVNATYTKVGNLVTLCAYVRTDLVTLFGSPSAAYMTGVPFQPISNDYFAVNVGYSAGWPGDEPTGGYLLHTSGTGTRINFHYRTSANGTSTTLSSTDFGDPSGDDANQLIFTITYHT
jgi:hypothetical protein